MDGVWEKYWSFGISVVIDVSNTFEKSRKTETTLYMFRIINKIVSEIEKFKYERILVIHLMELNFF